MRRERDDGFRAMTAITVVVAVAVIAAILIGIYARARDAGLVP